MSGGSLHLSSYMNNVVKEGPALAYVQLVVLHCYQDFKHIAMMHICRSFCLYCKLIIYKTLSASVHTASLLDLITSMIC